MLQVCALSFDYLEKSLLNNVQLSLASGNLLHLRGENGVGKTTLLRLLAGLLRPGSGEIRWNGQSIHDDLPTYQQALCYVGHKTGLSTQLTVKENCFFDLHWPQHGVFFPTLLERFALQGLADTPCYQLSAGQKRRLALLRLNMRATRLWLLDEPFVALDKPSTLSLAACLEHHLAKDGLLVMTSHQSLPASIRNYEEYFL